MFSCLFMSLCSVLHCFVLILSLISCLVTCCFVSPLSALSSLTSLSSVFLIYLPAVYSASHYHVYKCPTLVLRRLLSHCCLFPPCQHAGNGLQLQNLTTRTPTFSRQPTGSTRCCSNKINSEWSESEFGEASVNSEMSQLFTLDAI